MTPTRDQLIERAKAAGKSDADAARLADAYLAKKGAPTEGAKTENTKPAKASSTKPATPKPSLAVSARTAPSPTGPLDASPKAVAQRALAAMDRRDAELQRPLTPNDIFRAPLPTPKRGTLGERDPQGHADAATIERGLNGRLLHTMDNIVGRGLTESPETLLAGHRSGKKPIHDEDLLYDLESYERLSRDIDAARGLRKQYDEPTARHPLTSMADFRREDRRQVGSDATGAAMDHAKNLAKAYMDDDAPESAPAPEAPHIRRALAYEPVPVTSKPKRSDAAVAAANKLHGAGYDVEDDMTDDEVIRAAAKVK